MAKLKALLLSFKAQGSIGKTLTAQKRFGGTLLRKMPIPTDPKTLAQVYQRWDYQDYADLWHSLTADEQQAWETNARRRKITGFNYWMSTRLKTLPDLAGRWHFDQIIATLTPDSSKNLNHGTVFGATLVRGIIDKCLSFDGLDDRVHCGNVLDMGVADFTLMCFIKTLQVGQKYIINKNWITPFWDLRINAGKILGALGDGVGARVAISASTVNDDKWHHVACTFDRSANAQVYIDGEPDGAPVDITAMGNIDNPNPLVFGCQQSNASMANFFTGLIDEIRIYTRVLTASEMKRHAERRYPL